MHLWAMCLHRLLGQTVRSAGVVQLSLVIGSPREPTVQHDHVCVGA